MLSSCNPKQITDIPVSVVDSIKPSADNPCPTPLVVYDTIVLEVFSVKKYDSLLAIINKKNDSLFVERLRIERVKYYNGIVRKNKVQLKYLSGWITRAVK